jgi:hypothetical protein
MNVYFSDIEMEEIVLLNDFLKEFYQIKIHHRDGTIEDWGDFLYVKKGKDINLDKDYYFEKFKSAVEPYLLKTAFDECFKSKIMDLLKQ